MGIMLWMIGLLPMIIGKPFFCINLILYLIMCVIEVYCLKFFTIPRNFVKQMMVITTFKPVLKYILPTDEELDSRMKLYDSPIDMDNKVNKITY